MAVRDPYRRITNYDLKVDPEIVKARFVARKPKMMEQVSIYFPELVALEEAVKAILNGEGVPTSDIPFYLAFGRECWKRQRQFGGDVLLREVNILLQKWVARGFTQAILEKIRKDIFAVPAPGP